MESLSAPHPALDRAGSTEPALARGREQVRPDPEQFGNSLDRAGGFQHDAAGFVIGETLGLTRPEERDAGTVACLVQGMLQGAHIFRVHNVRAAWQAVRTIEGVTR